MRKRVIVLEYFTSVPQNSQSFDLGIDLDERALAREAAEFEAKRVNDLDDAINDIFDEDDGGHGSIGGSSNSSSGASSAGGSNVYESVYNVSEEKET